MPSNETIARIGRGFVRGGVGACGTQPPSSLVAGVLLYSILLAVCWSPRIRLAFVPGESVDFRLQDMLLPIALAYLLLAPKAALRARWDLVWGRWLFAFVYVATATTLLHLVAGQQVPDVVRIAYLGRTIEMFFLAMVVCGLYLRAGAGHEQVGRVLRLGVIGNLVWIGYQYAFGTNDTLLGDVGGLIESYGPKLIGEPSAFGAGMFLVFATALTVADYRTGKLRTHSMLLAVAAIVLSAYVVESRISLIIILSFLILLSGRRVRGLFSLPFVAFVMLAIGAATIAWADRFVGRFSADSLLGSLQTRLDIWSALAAYADNGWLAGVGPAGLTAPSVPRDEAHNIIVRAWLDFGLLGALLLFMVFGFVVVATARAVRAEQPTSVRWAAMLAGLTLAGVFAAGMVQDALTAVTSTHLLMVTLGIFVAELSRAQNDWPSVRENPATALARDRIVLRGGRPHTGLTAGLYPTPTVQLDR